MRLLLSTIFFLLGTFLTFAQERYFEEPRSYENKKTASFKIFQVIDDNSALAYEKEGFSFGKKVLLIGMDFYDEQIVSIENPKHIGICKKDAKTLPIVCSEEDALLKYKETFFVPKEDNEQTASSEMGNNISWSLNGRSIVGGMVSPRYNTKEEGTVVVDIIVDKTGEVVSAEIGRGTNIDNKELLSTAVDAAKRTKFSPLKSGTNNQSGRLTYRFKVNE